jgi:hypothetical protein
MPLSSEFKERFNKIKNDLDAYEFINLYGTHFVSEATMGANRGYSVYFKDG